MTTAERFVLLFFVVCGLVQVNLESSSTVGGQSRHATFSLLITLLIQTEVASENDWHLQRRIYLTDRYKEYFINPLFVEKVEQKPPQGEICGVVTCRR